MFRNLFRAAMLAAILVGVLAVGAAAPAVGLGEDPVLPVPTAADFGAQPILSQALLSPDGRRIVARANIRGATNVLIMAVGGEAGEMQRVALPENHQLEWMRWAGSNRILVSLSRADTLMGEEVRVTRMASLDLTTRQWTVIGPKQQGVDGDDLVHVDRDGGYVLMSTQETIYEYPTVFRVDLTTGKLQRIVKAQDDVWSWFADSTGVVRAGVGVRGDKWWLLYRASDKEDFKRTLRSGGDDGKADIDRFLPVMGGDQGYALANSANGRFALYRYDFKADQLGELLYENPTVDVDDFTLGTDGTLLGVDYIDERPEVAWFDPELKKLQARIDRALPGTINRIASFSEDRMRMLVWSGSATEPGAYFLYDRKANHMALLARQYERLADKRLAAMEPVRYKARDGLEIRGYLTLPPGRDPAKLPLIVMPHGGPFARDAWGYDAWVQYLASKGYAVLQPNFRGSTGFGRAFVEKGTGAWGRGMQDDIDDGVKWLADKGTADPKRVCIMGASFGGYAAMWAAVRNPEIYRCAISFAGISDVGSMLRYDRKSFSAPRYFRNWRERVQGDKGFALDTISPIKSVDKLTVPILIAHGDKDDNVPLYQSRRLHEALVKLGRGHDYVVYPGEGHGLADPAHATDFLNRVGAFLDTHNPS